MTLDELDRLCAEKIMNWNMGQATGWLPDGQITSGDGRKPWQPTRNIAQAWEVLEKLNYRAKVSRQNYKEFTVFLKWYDGDDDGGVWPCECNAEADTAPLAIVKACLKAKGVEV